MNTIGDVICAIGFILFISILLGSCGATFKHQVSGSATVNHVVTIDVEGLTSFFDELCGAQLGAEADAADIHLCAVEQVGRFVDFVEKNQSFE